MIWKRACVEAISLGAIGLIVGFGGNALRGSDAIKPLRNYFAKGVRPSSADSDKPRKADPPPRPNARSGSAVAGTPESKPEIENSTNGDAESPNATNGPDESASKKLEHAFQEIHFDEVVDAFNDPRAATGHFVFVDARRDDLYEAGHIPGAIQCDHYRLENYIQNVIDRVDGAEKVIVYCGGGNCEDSIFVCTDLQDFDVPFGMIYLYPGGWKEWSAKGMPSETGRSQ